MIVPSEDKVRSILCAWAEHNPRIVRIDLYGSFYTRKKWPPGDIDLAIEVSDEEGCDAFSYCFFKREQFEEELSHQMQYKVHIELSDSEMDTVKKGLLAGSTTIYQRQTGNL